MDFDWYELSHQGNKFKYKTDSFSQNQMGKRFSRLNHQYMIMAVASYGGPIALTSDKTQILTVREDDPSIQNICIYSNQGEISKQIKLANPFKNIIVHIQFLQDQMLLVIFQQGQIWLLDPLTGKYTKQQILGLYETQQVKEAKVFDNGFAFLTNKARFLYVRNAYQPQALEFISCEQQVRNSPLRLFWTVFSPKQIISQKVQLHLCHPIAGIIQVVQQDSKRLFYNRAKNQHVIESKLPNIKGISYISQLSPNRKMIVYFSAEGIYKQNPVDQLAQNMKKKKDKNDTLPQRQLVGYTYKIVFAPSLTSDSIGSQNFTSYDLSFVKANVHVDANNSPLSITWCGNKAIVVQFRNQDLYMYSVHGDYVRIQKDRTEKTKWTFIKQEIDGTRIISKNENKILRQIPASYISIFQAFSQQPGALLYTAYQAFEDEAPLQDDQIRKDKKKLAQGVQQCLKASRFQINYNKILKLMKAASYGKAFLSPNMIPNNLIYDTSKILRIVNCLRAKNRYITFQQFQSLKDDMMLKILLRYREHYLAFQIYQYLKKDQNFRVKIYTDWACCKVQNYGQSEESICNEIREKLEDEKGISFTQIAYRAIEVDRGQLALKLLSFQPSLAKKVPLLLWMGSKQSTEQVSFKFYQKALQQALRSRDLNLLFLAISRTMSSNDRDQKPKVPRQKIFQMLSNHRQGRAALLNYFRLFDSKSYIEYNRFFLKNTEAVIMQYLRIAFTQKSYENYQSLFQMGVELLKQFQTPVKDDWRKQSMPKVFGHLCQFIKHNPHIRLRNDKIKPVTIAKQLQVFLQKKDQGAVDDIKSFYKIPDKRVIMTQIKVFIDNSKWQDLQSFVQRNQKKYNLPVQLIADRVFAKRQDTWAMRLIAKMSSKKADQQYLLLQRIGRVKEAIDLAHDRKDLDALEDILSTLLDVNMIAYCNQKINLLRR